MFHRKYECYIRIPDNEKRFLIDLSECSVKAKELKQPSASSSDSNERDIIGST